MKNLSCVSCIFKAWEYTVHESLVCLSEQLLVSSPGVFMCFCVSWDCTRCKCVSVYLSLGIHVFYTIG